MGSRWMEESGGVAWVEGLGGGGGCGGGRGGGRGGEDEGGEEEVAEEGGSAQISGRVLMGFKYNVDRWSSDKCLDLLCI